MEIHNEGGASSWTTPLGRDVPSHGVAALWGQAPGEPVGRRKGFPQTAGTAPGLAFGPFFFYNFLTGV